MNIKRGIIFFILCVLALASILAGVVSTVNQLTMPDSVKLAVYAKENDVSLTDAETAKTLAEANKEQAEAQVTTVQGYIEAMGSAFILFLCVLGAAVGTTLLLFLLTFTPRHRVQHL